MGLRSLGETINVYNKFPTSLQAHAQGATYRAVVAGLLPVPFAQVAVGLVAFVVVVVAFVAAMLLLVFALNFVVTLSSKDRFRPYC